MIIYDELLKNVRSQLIHGNFGVTIRKKKKHFFQVKTEGKFSSGQNKFTFQIWNRLFRQKWAHPLGRGDSRSNYGDRFFILTIKDFSYGCLRATSAVILILGSISSILSRRSIACLFSYLMNDPTEVLMKEFNI